LVSLASKVKCPRRKARARAMGEERGTSKKKPFVSKKRGEPTTGGVSSGKKDTFSKETPPKSTDDLSRELFTGPREFSQGGISCEAVEKDQSGD